MVLPMTKRQSTLKPQLITAGAPGLPREFAVIETDDACEAAIMAQEAFADPAVSLVIWSNAADIVPESLKQSVRSLSVLRDAKRQQARTEIMPGLLRSFFSSDDDLEERAIEKHFSKLSAITGRQENILKEWRENCLDMTCDFAEAFDARSLKLNTIFQRNGDNHGGVHNDLDMRSNSLSVVRVVVGAPALYYGSEDTEKKQPWTVRPWDFAFVSRNVAQQAPSPSVGFDAEDRRIAEIYDIHSRREFVAGARRPLHKTFSRWPQPD